MNIKIMPMLLLASLTMLFTACGQSVIEIKVVDDSGAPVEGATVEINYVNFRDQDGRILKTDSEGKIRSTGSAELRINVFVSREGYYRTFYRKSNGTSLAKNVDHNLKVILRRKIKPVPMYACKIELQIPALSKRCGFDLISNDWVAPFGEGLVSDLVFIAEKSFQDSSNYETQVELLFEQDHEGIQVDAAALRGGKFFGSAFQSTRIGKLEGYSKRFSFSAKRSTRGYEGSTREQSFLFRTRAKLDKNGDLLTAHYGKIKDGIDVTKGAALDGKMPVLRFTVYFNPVPNERNLEFDPNQNLFGGLSRDQKVLLP